MRNRRKAGTGALVVAFIFFVGLAVLEYFGKTTAFTQLKNYQEETGIMQNVTVTDGKIKDAANLLNAYDIHNSLNNLEDEKSAYGYGVAY